MPTNSIFSAVILIPLGVTVYAECIYVFLSKVTESLMVETFLRHQGLT